MHGVLGSDMHYKAKQARVMGVPGTEGGARGAAPLPGELLEDYDSGGEEGGSPGSPGLPMVASGLLTSPSRGWGGSRQRWREARGGRFVLEHLSAGVTSLFLPMMRGGTPDMCPSFHSYLPIPFHIPGTTVGNRNSETSPTVPALSIPSVGESGPTGSWSHAGGSRPGGRR